MHKVMLVEDDRTMRSLLKTLLEIEGYFVIDVNEIGEDNIINTMVQENPDIVILDVHLAEGSGINIVKKIRTDKQLEKIKVLMSSGMELKDKCLDAGADQFLMKPYMPDELLIILHEFENPL